MQPLGNTESKNNAMAELIVRDRDDSKGKARRNEADDPRRDYRS